MPALPPVAKTLMVRFKGSDASDAEVGNRFFVQYGGAAPSLAELNTFAAAVAFYWNSYIAPLVSSEFTLTETFATDLSTPTSPTGSDTVSHPGTRSGTVLTLSTCVSLQFQTNLRRRGGHWHMQLKCGVASDTANTQTWSSTFIGDVVTNWESFIAEVLASPWAGAGTLAHVGVQYYGPPNRTVTGSTGRVRTVSTLLVTPETFGVTGYFANTRIGSMRRRLGKSGT